MSSDAVQFDIGPVYVGIKERRIPHSLNARLHWASRHRWNSEWKKAVEPGIWENKRKLGRLPMDKARVTVHLSTMKLLDTDNAYTAVKPVVDALKVYGVVVDDRPDCMELHVTQRQVAHRKDEKVTLVIERMENVQPAENFRGSIAA